MCVEEGADGLVVVGVGESPVGELLHSEQLERARLAGHRARDRAVGDQVVGLLVGRAVREPVGGDAEDRVEVRLAQLQRASDSQRAEQTGTGLLADADDDGVVKAQFGLEPARRVAHQVLHVAADQEVAVVSHGRVRGQAGRPQDRPHR